MKTFTQWMKLMEVGPGGGGPGSGMTPPKQDPTDVGGTSAFPDFHGPGSSELPPDAREQYLMKKNMKKKMKKRMKK